MNKETKAAAIAVFEKYPNAKNVFITSDNQAFLKEDRARLHDKDYTEVKRSDVMEDEANADAPKAERKNAPDTIALVAKCETIEDLDALVTGEDRKTVLAAIAERRVVLTEKV